MVVVMVVRPWAVSVLWQLVSVVTMIVLGLLLLLFGSLVGVSMAVGMRGRRCVRIVMRRLVRLGMCMCIWSEGVDERDWIFSISVAMCGRLGLLSFLLICRWCWVRSIWVVGSVLGGLMLFRFRGWGWMRRPRIVTVRSVSLFGWLLCLRLRGWGWMRCPGIMGSVFGWHMLLRRRFWGSWGSWGSWHRLPGVPGIR